jgi:uncharacterized protein involved in outer membrane biogenesis
VKFFSSKRRVLAAAVVILLGLFVLRPGASQLKARITNSISRAVARPADVGSVQLRLLPPGFDLQNVVIYEDPAFGAEPMLRAPEVTASVRLTSLLRGRLDISRLELTEPSLNLVRRADGRWNWEALLERTARTPLAPTAKSKSEARPGFPYIEASSGRINFKAGAEKKPYALLNADFALWQESENEWGVRLTAEPLRTDMSLSDTGVLRMNGTWQRAGSLRETPLQFSVEWDRAQLGQLTKLVSGNDKGWRGEVRVDAALNGIPAAMKVAADMSIADFHRYDIADSAGLRLAAHCNGSYSSVEAMVRGIECGAPVGDGRITLSGDAGLPGMHAINLALKVEDVPANALAQVARRAKKNLPADLISAGMVQGDFSVTEDAESRALEFAGRGEIANLRLQSAKTKVEFAAASIPFVLSSGRGSAGGAKSKGLREDGTAQSADGLRVEFGPFPAALGRPAPAQVRGWIGRAGYEMAIRGDGDIVHTLRLATLLGLPAMKASVEGTAQIDLQIAGSWAGNVAGTQSSFALPEVMGTVQLRNVQAMVRGVKSRIEIVSAELKLLHDGVRVEQLNAQAADAHWTGSLTLPRGCGMAGACVVGFNLNSDDVSLSAVHDWLSAAPSQRRWYQVLTAEKAVAPSLLENLRASGKVSVGRLRIHNVAAEKVSAALDLEHGKLKLSDLRGDLLGGKHRGEWLVDFSGATPIFSGSGTLSAISLQKMADAMNDPWISGTAGGNYQITESSMDGAAFWQAAEGTLQFDVRDGALPHIALARDEELRVMSWNGHARLHAGKIEIEQGKLVSPVGAYEMTGTASLGRALDLKLTRAGAGYSITGTLAEPRVEMSTAETQARLKP